MFSIRKIVQFGGFPNNYLFPSSFTDWTRPLLLIRNHSLMEYICRS